MDNAWRMWTRRRAPAALLYLACKLVSGSSWHRLYMRCSCAEKPWHSQPVICRRYCTLKIDRVAVSCSNHIRELPLAKAADQSQSQVKGADPLEYACVKRSKQSKGCCPPYGNLGAHATIACAGLYVILLMQLSRGGEGAIAFSTSWSFRWDVCGLTLSYLLGTTGGGRASRYAIHAPPKHSSRMIGPSGGRVPGDDGVSCDAPCDTGPV
eukprot:273917-Chlamydomonas_euryale.AAC.3